ncbi:MAG TPA: hopanoid biosynthesis-associated protein HpnK [Coleofasciculaceae cyanobacterium]
MADSLKANVLKQQATPTPLAESSPQPRSLIVNGDDFGFSTGVNRAIIAAHQSGVLTSTSLMVSGAAFEEAVALAKMHPTLGVGLHLTLGCGRSVLPPSQIPHLVDAAGNFPDDPVQVGLRYQFNPAARRELPLEIRAQLEKFRQTGLPLAHVDGHLHHHVHPVVLREVVNLADEFKIKVIRLPSEELGATLKLDQTNLMTKVVWSLVFAGLRRHGEKLLNAQGIRYADRVYGLLQTGRMTEDYLLGLIPQIQANVVEIYSHPAIAPVDPSGDALLNAGESELGALLSEQVRHQIIQHNFRLINYLDL